MKTITKKQIQVFVDKVCDGLLQLGAKKVKDKISNFRSFELETVVGKLEINVDTDSQHCYTAFACFDNVEQAKTKFPCNPHSGKYNVHIGKTKGMTPLKAADIVLSAFLQTLPK
ncbi:MAG: hypothetical protein AABY15_06765 [Nanoarchaeota archaeon]